MPLICISSLDIGDVLVLCYAFEEFSNSCMKGPKQVIDPSSRVTDNPKILEEEGNNELDPAHYVGAPQLSWDAMLKQNK